MAFQSFSFNDHPTQLQVLLNEIRFQQQKEAALQAQGDVGNFISRGTTYWTDVFVRHFLFQMDRSIDADDLLFFIRKRHVGGSSLPKFQTDVEVFRKDSKKLPIGDPQIMWQETVFLNLLIHQLEYTLTLAICTRTSPKDLQVLKRHSQKVYASPSRRRMDTKGEVEEITYPYLSFMVDNFDEVYSEMTVRDGEMVCVELVAADRDHGFQAVLFLGSIRYDALKRVYDSRASLGSKMAQRMTFGLFSTSHHQRVEYVRLRGPRDKGHAEVAVSKPKGGGVETPTSEPGFCMTDGMWDSESESDTEDFIFKHHRRLSDPSSNLNNFTKSGWKSLRGGEKKTRSQNEGLDYCGLAEIEAGDVRDDRGSGAVWCCGCCGCECLSVGSGTRSADAETQTQFSYDPCTVPDSEVSERCEHSCCCGLLAPFPRSQSFAMDSIPMNPLPASVKTASSKLPSGSQPKPSPSELPGNSTESTTANRINCDSKTVRTENFRSNQQCQTLGRPKAGKIAQTRRHPLIPSKTIVVPPTSSPFSELLASKEKAMTVACLQDAKLIYRDKLLRYFPNKLASTGVRVFYLCDKPELDDGAYNPLWTMRGFTQTLYVWRETRRAQSVPLNAFLTYITLPYTDIIKDIMESREEPVLTF